MSRILLKNVTKQFDTRGGRKVTAVDDFTLEIKEGECFSFLGPSGCGKTTALRMIAGFEDLTGGEIWLGDRPVSVKSKNLYVPPEDRGLGMVFQAFAVWPHLNVFENVAFPLRVKKTPSGELREKVMTALAHTDLAGAEKAFPSDLSGGEQQRIALARAIVTSPSVMLLDEPLSNLDPKLRESMRFEIKALQKKFNFTIIFVTHDQSEAMALSDRMLVMDMGRIIQAGTPREMYEQPANQFVYGFLGQSSFLKVRASEGRIFPAGSDEALDSAVAGAPVSGEGLAASRPNEITLGRTAGEGGIRGRVEKRLYMTYCVEYHVDVAGQTVRVHGPHRDALPEGSECFLGFRNARWYDAESAEAELERTERQVI